MRYRAFALITILAIALISGLGFYRSSALPDSSCFGSTNISGTGTFAVSCTITSIVGDFILVGVVQASNVAQNGGLFLIGTPTDTLFQSYGISVPQTTDGNNVAGQQFGEIEMFNTTAISAGSDTISSSCRQANGGGGADFCDMWVQEVPVIAGGVVQTARGSCRNTITPNCAIVTNSTITPHAGDFLFAVSVAQLSPLPTIGAGAGYTLLAGQNSSGATFFVHSAEHAISWVSGSTQGGFSSSSAGGTVQTSVVGLIDVGGIVTTTQTITGFLVPNFVNGLNNFSWLYFLLVVLVPMGEIIGVMTLERSAILDRHAVIFIFLSLLLLDSIFGVMLNVVTVAMPFIFGILFGVYLWRGRG